MTEAPLKIVPADVRYFATVFFPSAVAYAIYCDYNRTQEYKKKKALLLQLEQCQEPDHQ